MGEQYLAVDTAQCGRALRHAVSSESRKLFSGRTTLLQTIVPVLHQEIRNHPRRIAGHVAVCVEPVMIQIADDFQLKEEFAPTVASRSVQRAASSLLSRYTVPE